MSRMIELRQLSGPRILVFSRAYVGEIVHDQMLFSLLRHQNPDVVVDVVAPLWSEALFRRMPQVGRLWERPSRGTLGLAQRRCLARRIRGHYVQSITGTTAAKVAIIPWLAGIPVRTGYANSEIPALLNDLRPPAAHRRDRKEQLLRLAPAGMQIPDSLPVPKLQYNVDQAIATAQKLGLDLDAPTVALAPGCSNSADTYHSRRWPAERYAQLAHHFIEAGFRICVLGLECDNERGEIIKASNPDNTVNLCGRTSLDEAIDIFSQCHLAVCNDSGLLHVAAAVETPAVGIYSSTPSWTTPIMAKRFVSVSAEIPCSPCWKIHCPYRTYTCLTRIKPETVSQAAFKLLADQDSNAT